MRDIWEPQGRRALEAGWRREVAAANDVTCRAMRVASAAAAAHASVIIENPVWRGEGSPWGKPEYRDHCSLWDMYVVMRWRRLFRAESVDCAQCAFGGEFQKLTTFLYTPDLHTALSSFEQAVCTHDLEGHDSVAHGVDSEGRFVTARAAAYPAALNRALAFAIAFPWRAAFCPSACCALPESSAQVEERPGLGVRTDPFLGPSGMRAGVARPHARVSNLLL